MLKKDVRIKYKKLRAATSADLISLESIAIANAALKLPIWNYNYYHLFLPIANKKEVDTLMLLSILQGKDKHVVVPKITSENSLEHQLLSDNTKFEITKWGISEPTNGIPVKPALLDVIFVPLLAFDKKGNRVGYGKGFYDTFFKNCKKDVLKIGVSFFEAEEEITDVTHNDVALDYCITPEKTYCFKDDK